MKQIIIIATIFLIAFGGSIVAEESSRIITYDLVIKNGRVINPETNLDQTGLNIGITNGKITTITEENITGKQMIDATGLVVTPGFIDLLSYDPTPIGVWNKLGDGITTNIGMHGTTINSEQWFSYFDAQKLPLHYGGSFFYTQARNKLGLNRYQTATPNQIEVLYLMGEKAIQDGCLGISMSLEYVPGISAAECLSMNHLAQKYNVGVYYHVRYSTMDGPGTNFDALNEVIGYARETGAAVHIDHINSTGGTYTMKESLALLDKARAEGLDITACEYPYNYWATYLNSARFDPGWQSRFHIAYHDLQLGGSAERLTKESFAYYQKQGKLVNAYAIPEEDIRDALRCPWVMMGSDGILEPGYNNHPRASGMCARLIGHYVRDEKVLSLMDAIAKLTILPAKRMEAQCPSLKAKGRITVGADADIVVFNYEKIIDQATPEHPEYMSSGVEYVLVGGGLVKDPQGFHKNVRNGKAVRSEFISAKFSKRVLLWKKTSIPVISYRNVDYIDIDWLVPLGYRLEPAKINRKIFIKPASSSSDFGNIPGRVPSNQLGEWVLERGITAVYKDQNQTLVSIGEHCLIPLTALKQLDILLEESPNVIKIKPIPVLTTRNGPVNYWTLFQQSLTFLKKTWQGLTH